MSRNGSGTYTLPSGNPVVSGTLIEATWANSTLSDIASALTDSLSRSGQGGMTAAFRAFDGTSSVPGIAWGSETTTGWYRAGAGDMRLVVTGSEIMRYQSTGVAITGTLSVSGNATVGGTLAITGAVTLTANPTLSAGTANGVAYLNGSKVLTTGSALTFDSSDRLIVGGASAAIGQRLEVVANASGGAIGIRGRSSDATGVLSWHANAAATEYARIQSDNTSSLIFGVGASGSEQMRLTSTGLGIGTSSPGMKLDVAGGDIRITSASAPSLYVNNTSASGKNYRLISADSGNLIIQNTGIADLVYLNTAGNLGLGVTPSAWNASSKAVQIPSGNLEAFGSGALNLTFNAFRNTSGIFIYNNNGNASIYGQNSGRHEWYTAPSGTAGNTISFTQAMTLDASGNLGVGTTSPGSKLDVYGAIRSTLAADTNYRAELTNSGGATQLLAVGTGATMQFWVQGSERARIDSSGNFGIGTTGVIGRLNVVGGNAYTIPVTFAGATGNASWITGQAPQAVTVSIYASNATYCSAVYTASDRRAKENITPLKGAAALEFVTRTTPVEFDWKAEGSHDTGYIAQDLLKLGYGHLVSSVVDETMKEETDEDGNVSPAGARFIVKYDAIVPVLAAAIQEQQAIIEQLKADVAALKGA